MDLKEFVATMEVLDSEPTRGLSAVLSAGRLSGSSRYMMISSWSASSTLEVVVACDLTVASVSVPDLSLDLSSDLNLDRGFNGGGISSIGASTELKLPCLRNRAVCTVKD